MKEITKNVEESLVSYIYNCETLNEVNGMPDKTESAYKTRYYAIHSCFVWCNKTHRSVSEHFLVHYGYFVCPQLQIIYVPSIFYERGD